MTQSTSESLEIVLNEKPARKQLFRAKFKYFYAYHSGNELTDFHEEWCDSLQDGKDMMIIAFRGSAKTTIVRWFVVWCICYQLEEYIIVQSYEDKLSGAWVREVAKMLMLPQIVADYGQLFPLSMKREDMSKSSATSFESTNGVKLEARSTGGTIRGANTTTKEGKSTRPTMLILDDIDVEKSVQNTDIIDRNEAKIIGETMEAMSQAKNRTILLGNVINEDGVVPRFKKRFSHWQIFEKWLIENGECVWDIFTDEVIEKLKSRGERSFAQNYLGIPFTGGQTIIRREKVQFAQSVPAGARYVMGIDPAFSEKTDSDEMGITLTAHVGENKYVVVMHGLAGREKDEEAFGRYVESMYQQYSVSVINIEANNGGEILARILKKRGLAVQVKKSVKDKVTRLREYEGCFDRGEVFFLPGTEQGVEQLLSFPFGSRDDRVDSMVFSFEQGSSIVFRNF